MHFSWGQKKVAQQGKVPVAKPDDLSLTLGYLLWKERTIPGCFLTSSHMWYHACVYTSALST